MGMAKYDRLLYILNLLRSRKNLNAQKIALECGVTERSVYRDIISLSEANIPIYYDNGYKLASDNFLSPLNFDLDEYQYLKLALESSPLNKTDRYLHLSKQVRAKLEAVLSDSVRRKARYKPNVTSVEISSSSDHAFEEYFSIIERAIEGCCRIRVTYESIESGVNERLVEPYFIVFRGRAFYFVGFSCRQEKWRTYRMGRIRDLQLTEETFVRQEGINAESYFDGSWQVYGGDPVEVVVRFNGAAARVILTGSHHKDESIERIDEDTILYTVTTRGLEEIERWLLGFGSEACVISPPELRLHLLKIGEYLSKEYGAE